MYVSTKNEVDTYNLAYTLSNKVALRELRTLTEKQHCELSDRNCVAGHLRGRIGDPDAQFCSRVGVDALIPCADGLY